MLWREYNRFDMFWLFIDPWFHWNLYTLAHRQEFNHWSWYLPECGLWYRGCWGLWKYQMSSISSESESFPVFVPKEGCWRIAPNFQRQAARMACDELLFISELLIRSCLFIFVLFIHDLPYFSACLPSKSHYQMFALPKWWNKISESAWFWRSSGTTTCTKPCFEVVLGS